MRLSVALTPLLLAAPAAAQAWTLQSPAPTEQELHTVSFLSADHGYVGGLDGVWMQTLDGGDTWSQVAAVPRSPLFQDNPFHRSMFVDSQHGWVIGNNDDAFRTVDGGATWTRMSAFPAGSYYHLDFVDSQHGWAGGNGSVVATTDGGASWNVQTWYNQHGNVVGVDFRDAQTGLFTNSPLSSSTYARGLWRTDDGGTTWNLLRAGTFGLMRWTGPNRIVMVGPGTFEHSSDGGQTWQSVSRPFDLVAWDRAGSTGMAALANDGSIWASSDLGMTWSMRHGPQPYLTGFWGDLRFLTPQLGFAVGRGGFVARTQDGGATWTQLGSGHGASTWEDLEMATPMRGLACGPNGSLVVTTDGGRKWRAGARDANGNTLIGVDDFESVDTVGSSTFFAASDSRVLRSDDSGATWQEITANLSGIEIRVVDFHDAQTGYVAGQSAFGFVGAVWRTDDGGQSWTDVSGAGALNGIYAMEVLGPQEVWASGASQYVYRTTNGGQSWVPYDTPNTFSILRTSIAFAPEDPDTGWISGAHGYVAKTDDGGITWNLQTLPNLPSNESPLDIAVLDADRVWISTGTDGYVYETVDGGSNWTRRSIAPYVYPGLAIASIDVTDTGHLWAAGAAGRIWSEDPPTPEQIFLHRPTLQRGQPAQLVVSNAQAGEEVWFAYTLAGAQSGAGPTPPGLGGLSLDLLTPVETIGAALANAGGKALLAPTVPAAAQLATVWLQAVVKRGPSGAASVGSNVQQVPVLP